MEDKDFKQYLDSFNRGDLDIKSFAKEASKPPVELDPEDTWKGIKEIIRIKVGDANFKTWFSNTYIESISNGVVDLSCANDIQRNTIETDYKNIIINSLKQHTDLNFVVNILSRKENTVVKEKYEYLEPTKKKLEPFDNSKVKNLFSDIEDKQENINIAIQKAQLNPKYTFENFVVGSHNRLAEAVARAVAEEPGKIYNPIFFYGNTGVGKTHLMQAIGNEVIKNDFTKEVVYVSIEQFLNELIGSIRSKKDQDFRDKYRKVDLLIIDDIQFVETYPKTQEALFHTFNTLHQANKQIVLASDRPPSEIKNLTDRLRSRFEGGMVADIGLPDYETRMAILQQIMDDKGADIPTSFLDLIAINVQSNVRELEGALNKLISLDRLGELPTEDDAKKFLQFDIGSKRKKITAKKVIDVVASVFEVKASDITRRIRTSHISKARQVVMYILRYELDLPLEKVAREVNRTDHTTVIHACERVERFIEQENGFKEKLDTCIRYLSS